MIRIRVGDAWKHDPEVSEALRGASRRTRAAADIVDVLALEVDGVDIGAGRTEGALLPSLEALLRAVARIVSGAPQASVPFEGGGVELVLRRRGASALLTVVAPDPPSRVLARDVEVEVDALAAAALEAAAALFRDLVAAGPAAAASREARRLREAARRLRAAEPRPLPPPPSTAPSTRRSPRTDGPPADGAPRPAEFICCFELHDDEGLAGVYAGGRPDLGSLLAPGRTWLARGDKEIAAFAAPPFLVMRDLSSVADRIARAVRAGDRHVEVEIAHAGRGSAVRLAVDLARGVFAADRGPEVPCSPLDLARVLLEATLDLARGIRARNPRQGENAYVVELESAAAERLAHVYELAGGDVVRGAPSGVRAAAPRAPPQLPLGPGLLRRLAFRRTHAGDVGPPAGDGLWHVGGLAIAAGETEIAALDLPRGRVVWRAEGCELAAVVTGAIFAARGASVECLSVRTGRRRWVRSLPGGPLRGVLALARGPYLLVEAAALTAVDPGSGRTLWRFAPPAASRLAAAPFGGLALAAADTGAVYGLDAAGTGVFRLRAPGPLLFAPVPAGRLAVVAAAAGPGAVLLAIDPTSPSRVWEAPLDFVPSGAPVVSGSRLMVPGTLGGDPVIAALGRDGRPSWTAAPPLAGPVSVAAAPGGGLAALDGAGSVAALAADGTIRWTFVRPAGHPPPTPAPPTIVRGTVFAAGDGLAALEARSGTLLGLVPGIAPVKLLVAPDLGLCALDGDGAVTAWRLATHLSVV